MEIANNLSTFIFSLFPIITYAFLLYLAIPSGLISVHRSRRYLISGLMSPLLVFLFYFIFPWWGESASCILWVKYLIYTFIQIAILEESCKYLVFNLVNSERLSSKEDLPVAIMFYSLMTSMGFALTENICYMIAYYELNFDNPLITSDELKDSLFSISALRSTTAVVMHMVCGIVMGYLVSRPRAKKMNSQPETTNEAEGGTLWKKIKYSVLAILVASIYHGIYNMNLMLPNNNYKTILTIIILGSGICISYFLIKSLIKESKEINLLKLN